MSSITVGQAYRVTKCPTWEYLTEGAVYIADHAGKAEVGLHRPQGGPMGGAGTYVARHLIRDGLVVLEPVYYDGTTNTYSPDPFAGL